MASNLELSQETVHYFKKCFEEVAENGSINADQLEECLQIAGLDATMFELDWMLRHFDKNRNGKLEVEELMENLPTLFAHSVREDDLRKAFMCFDMDGDGYIRLPELKKVLTANNFMTGIEAGELINELVEEFDSDGDGKFDYGAKPYGLPVQDLSGPDSRMTDTLVYAVPISQDGVVTGVSLHAGNNKELRLGIYQKIATGSCTFKLVKEWVFLQGTIQPGYNMIPISDNYFLSNGSYWGFMWRNRGVVKYTGLAGFNYCSSNGLKPVVGQTYTMTTELQSRHYSINIHVKANTC